MLKNYLKTAFRNLLRNRAYSFINIAGLSLGLSCAMLILLYVKDEVSFDRFHKDSDRIYIVGRTITRPNGDVAYSVSTGYFQGPRFTAAIPEIQHYVRYQSNFLELKKGADVESHEVCYADENFFSAFSFPLLYGSAKTALREPHSVVLTEDMAEKQFGTRNAVGKVLLLKEEGQFIPYSVSAVAKRCPQNSSLQFSIVLPLRVSQKDLQENQNWFNSFLNTFIVLAPQSDPKVVEAKMKKVFEADAAQTIVMIKEKYGVKDIGLQHFLEPFIGLHLDNRLAMDGGVTNKSKPIFSYILSGIALFILLIACINFVNLTMARSLQRAREIGVRKVMGGRRKDLILQFLGESFLLSLGAFLLAILIVQMILPVFNRLSNKSLAFSYLLDMKLIIGYGVLFLITSFLAGSYPALLLSKYNPVQVLYRRFEKAGQSFIHQVLVVIQFSLASFLIIGTLVIFSQFQFLTREKLGYDDSHLVTVELQQGMGPDKARLVEDALMADPHIAGVAAKNGGQWGTTVKVNGERMVTFAYETIDEAYLPLLRVPIVRGRNFSRDFPSDTKLSVLVNESFVKEAGWKDPIGQQVLFLQENEKYTVVGIVKDYHFQPLTEKISPQLFTMKPNGLGLFLVKLKPNSEAATLPFIEKTFRSLFPLNSYHLSFKDQENSKNYEAEAKWKQILLFGALLTIFISCIGLFGLSVSAAEKRRKEIGIRKVLGASVSGVVGALARDFIKLVVIAMLIAIPFAWLAAQKWLENYPYRIALGWGIFAIAGLLVILVSMITVSFQAIKAAVANPVESLRTE